MIIVNARFLTQSVTGVQRFAIELSKRMKQQMGDTVLFVAPNGILDQSIGSVLEVKLIGKRHGHLWEQIDLPKYLKKIGNPLLLNFCNTAPLLYKNKIITIHDIAFEVYPQTYSKGFLYFYKYLIPRIIKSSRHILTVSDFSKKEIIKYYHTDYRDISVIYNAADSSFHEQADCNLSKESYFLAVSSLNHRKNLPLVLEAFKIFSTNNIGYKLFVVGGLDTKSFAKLNLDKYKKIQGIIFKGRISDNDLIKMYSNALAFLYPSFYEGFGIPPLEAQSCNCPCIISKNSCFPEIFGDSVLYCDATNANSLALKMQDILVYFTRNSTIALGKANKERYNWDNSTHQLLSVLYKYL